MKKMLAFFFALLLPLSACAETAENPFNAPSQVVETVSSGTGKTVITWDATVHVPAVQQMYIIPVNTASFEDAMVQQLASCVWPSLSEKKMIVEDETDTETQEGKTGKSTYNRHLAYLIQKPTKQNDVRVQVSTGYTSYPLFAHPLGSSLTAFIQYDAEFCQNKTVNYNMLYMYDEVQGQGIEDHPLSSEEAAAIGQELLTQLTDDDFALFAVGRSPGLIYPTDEEILRGESGYTDTYSYALTYTRLIDGVPVLPSLFETMDKSSLRDDLYVPPVGYEQILMAVNREGEITAFCWENPYEIVGGSTPVTLLPFDTILSIARRTMPLKYQAGETEGNITLSVSRIDLGYMALLQWDSVSFALTPVWSFYGNGDAPGMNECMRPLLTINAVDGTVVDLVYGY